MLLWAVCAGLLVYLFGHAVIDVTYVTLADGRRNERTLPSMFRVLLPWVSKMTWYTRMMGAATRKKVQQQLVMAGYDTLLTPDDIFALKVLNPLVIGSMFCILFHYTAANLPGFVGDALREREVFVYILLLLFLYMQPILWLKEMVKKRHKSIERALPFVLDLLTLSVEAGLDLMTGLRRIIERRNVDPLGEELIRVFREIQVGKTRREALRSMSDRVNHTDIKSLVNAMSQADELGVSMGTILRIQAEQLRTRRFQRAEKLANQAPVKMLFPLICFIFPSVFLVMLGPIFIDMVQKGF